MHLSPLVAKAAVRSKAAVLLLLTFCLLLLPLWECNCSMFCCTLLYVHSSIAIILMGTRETVALLYLSSWCLVMVEQLFLTAPRDCLRFVVVVFPDSIAIILMGTRETVALLYLSSWCLVMVEQLFLTAPRDCLRFVVVVFPDHTHLLLFISR